MKNFFASSIVGIDGLLRELSSAQGLLKTFVHQDKILILEKSNQIIGLFVTRMDLHTLRSQLVNKLHQVESLFLEEIQTQEPLTLSTRATLISQTEKWFESDLRKQRIFHGVERILTSNPSEKKIKTI